MIERQVSHLVRLVDDLLDVSRITRGKVELKREPRRARRGRGARRSRWPSPLLEQRQPSADGRRAARGLVVDGDPARLAQVVVEPADQRRQVHRAGRRHHGRRAAREGDDVVVRVRDNGIGIAPRDAAARLRPVRAGAAGARPRARRPRPRPGDRAQPRRAARRHGRGAQRRARARQRVHGAAAARDARRRRARRRRSSRPRCRARRRGAARPRRRRQRRRGASCSPMLLEQLGCTTRVAHDGPAALRVADEASSPTSRCSTSACR